MWLAINANAAGRQGTGVERNRRAQKELSLDHPILLNETGQLGRLLARPARQNSLSLMREATLSTGEVLTRRVPTNSE